MRNSSPSKSLKIATMDGAFFRGRGKSRNGRRIPFFIRHLRFDIGHCRRRSRFNARLTSGDFRAMPNVKFQLPTVQGAVATRRLCAEGLPSRYRSLYRTALYFAAQRLPETAPIDLSI